MWRFVQISDPHFAAMSDGSGNNLLVHSLMPEIAMCLRRDLRGRNVDFMLVTGDLTAHQSRDGVFAARDMLDSIGIPYYPVGGNQDFVGPHSRDWFVQAYHEQLPVQDTVYSFTHKNLHVCVLDPWWQWEDGTLCAHRDGTGALFQWALPPSQFEWLRADLQQHRTLPTILVMHYPALPLPDRLFRPKMLEPGYITNGKLLVEFLEEFRQVVAVFAGHAHMHYIVRESGVVHVVTGALSEFPVEYREIEVHRDRLEVRTVGLSDKTYAARSLVQNNTWTAGEECDRSVTIPLRNAPKRVRV